MDQSTGKPSRPGLDEVCPLCNGVEWTFTVNEGVSSAKRCECFRKKLSAKVVPEANIPSKYAHCSFDNFERRDPNPAAADSLNTAVRVISGYFREFPPPSDPRGLLIWGSNGIGKTHLAVAAFRRILDQGVEGRFINYQGLLELIRSGYDKAFGESRTQKYVEIEQVPLLLIDDLGANRITDWVKDTVTHLISFRHDHQLPTIVTTNYRPSPTEDDYLGDRIGERAASRLREMCKIISMPNVPDRRGTNPHSRFLSV
ncbi:MAG: ATP-binding protein [Bryobacteraceae bacterium]